MYINYSMKIRTIYLKVTDFPASIAFWEAFLEVEPAKLSDTWCEFPIGDSRLGLLLDDYGDEFSGSSCVPVFEYTDAELPEKIMRAKQLGAHTIVNGDEEKEIAGMVLLSPDGHEFEISALHG